MDSIFNNTRLYLFIVSILVSIHVFGEQKRDNLLSSLVTIQQVVFLYTQWIKQAR